LLNASVRGDLLVDLFGGSGSTLIACKQKGRR
jgi:DNA modification methylase